VLLQLGNGSGGGSSGGDLAQRLEEAAPAGKENAQRSAGGSKNANLSSGKKGKGTKKAVIAATVRGPAECRDVVRCAFRSCLAE
jgi:hypothetical protein